VQRRQRIFDRRLLRRIHQARRPCAQYVERGAADDLARLRPWLGVGADAAIKRQLVDRRAHHDVDEGEQLLRRHLAIVHQGGELADAGAARIQPAFENRVAQQARGEIAEPDAVARVEPARFGRQREGRDRIGDDHVAAIGDVMRHMAPQIDVEPGFVCGIHERVVHRFGPSKG
jgi:hypothetical protein